MAKKTKEWLNAELFDALESMYLSDHTVEELLDMGADVNARNEEGMTPLMFAIQEDAWDWNIETLLAHGADTSLRDNEGRTAALVAAYTGNLEILKQIIRLPGDLLICDNEGKDLLTYAVMSEYAGIRIPERETECLRYLLQQGIQLEHQDEQGWTALHHAAAIRNEAAVYYLLKAGASPDTPDKKCRHTPLITAVCENHPGCVKLLLQGGAAPEQKDYTDSTALEYAAQQNLLESLRLLLETGRMKKADIQAALCIAAEEGQAEALRLLFPHGGESGLRSETGFTLLGAAARSGSEECLDFLLSQGYQLNEQDAHGLCALDHAYQAGRTQLAHKMLQLGASPTLAEKQLSAQVDVAELDSLDVPGGCTPLMHTAACGMADEVKRLLQNGAIVHETNDFGLTALHLAVFHGQTECTRLLLEHGARIPQATGFTPSILDSAAERGFSGCLKLLLQHSPQKRKSLNRLLFLAAAKGSIESVDFLLQQGAQLNARDDDKLTPLHYAARTGKTHCLRYLVERGAKLNARNLDDASALHIAAEHGRQAMLRYLLEQKLPVDDRSIYYTPLMQAALAGHAGCVQLLLEHGANPQARDEEKWTVLHFAAECTDPECVRLLLEAGAKPNLRNSAKATPLMRAVEYNRPDIVRLLLQHGAHPHTPDCTGHSPLVEAILKGYTECADILIGAKPGKKERERYFADALEAARQQGNTRLIEKLQNHLP